MKIRRQIIFIAFLAVVLLPGYSLAAIAFTGGKWETTFNCAESTQFNGSLCNGMTWAGNWYFDSHRTAITSTANNPGGAGGRGARFWIGDGVNMNTGTIMVSFPVKQKELWIRYYVRYQAGFSWSSFTYDKQLYIKTDSGTDVITGFHQDPRNTFAAVAQGTPNYYPLKSTNFGWNHTMGGSIGDGKWHCYELYIKMDTNGANGSGKIWIDGVLKAQASNVNWSNNSAAAQQGWQYFMFHSNQRSPVNGPYYVDYDDIVVYNTTPPKRDNAGNPFIGTLGASSPAPPPLQPPRDFRVVVK